MPGVRAFSIAVDKGSSITSGACGLLDTGAPRGHRAAQDRPKPGLTREPIGVASAYVLVQLEILEHTEAQAHASEVRELEIREHPAPTVQPEPTLTEEPPAETSQELEAAPQPSCPDVGAAKDHPSKELPDSLPPAVTTGLREGMASTAPASSCNTAPSPGHAGSHGGGNQGVQPGLLSLTGETLLSFTRATVLLLQEHFLLLVLVVSIYVEVLEIRKRSRQGRVPAAPPAPRGGLLLQAWRSLHNWTSGLFAPDVLPRTGSS
ncbi:CMT1A duplicated region transcript 15 protein-like protein [Plecturocebus cupreus]